jgi:hypothetical protein
LANEATPGPWKSWREGNQYVDTGNAGKLELVGASNIPQLRRAYNPHKAAAFGADKCPSGTVRFRDADADYIAACNPREILALIRAHAALVDENRRLRGAMGRAVTYLELGDEDVALGALRRALLTDPAAGETTCEHSWVDARNEAVQSGEWCSKCNAIREAPTAGETEPG